MYDVSEGDGSLEVCAVVNAGTVVNPVTLSVSLSPLSATGKFSLKALPSQEKVLCTTYCAKFQLYKVVKFQMDRALHKILL